MSRNPHRALEAIEVLVGGSFAEDLEWLIDGRDGEKNRAILDPRLVEAAEIIGKIYMIAHAEVSNCKHENWEKLKYEILANKNNNEN